MGFTARFTAGGAASAGVAAGVGLYVDTAAEGEVYAAADVGVNVGAAAAAAAGVYVLSAGSLSCSLLSSSRAPPGPTVSRRSVARLRVSRLSATLYRSGVSYVHSEVIVRGVNFA